MTSIRTRPVQVTSSAAHTRKVLDIVSGKFCLFVRDVLAQPSGHRVLGLAGLISRGLGVQAVLLKNQRYTITILVADECAGYTRLQ